MEEHSKRSSSPAEVGGGVIGSPGQLLARISRLLARVADARLRPLGMAPGQLPVFAALSDGSERSQTVLASQARIEQPTMAATLTRMERDGLIARRPDPGDKRSSLIRLTPTALAKVPDVMTTMTAAREELLDGFSPLERDHLVALLHRIITNLEAADDRTNSPTPSAAGPLS